MNLFIRIHWVTFLPDKSQFGVTSSGVPGSVAGLIYALEKYGTLTII